MGEKYLGQLTAKSAPATGDILVLEDSEDTKKIDYDALANAILNKLTIKTYTVAGGTNTLIAAIDALNSKTYSTSGLTYAGCSHIRGGYCVQGNLVIVNITVNTTSAGATVSGFPEPQFTIGFGGYDGSNEKPIFAYMNTSGILVIPGAITQLGSLNISVTYIKA